MKTTRFYICLQYVIDAVYEFYNTHIFAGIFCIFFSFAFFYSVIDSILRFIKVYETFKIVFIIDVGNILVLSKRRIATQ